MKVALVSLNVSFVHKNLALRWLYVAKPEHIAARIIEQSTKNIDACLKAIMDYDPDVVGLSTFIFNIKESLDLIQQLKKHKPSLRIYCGGPEATYNPQPFFDYGVDGICRGEAEFSFWKVVENEETKGCQTHLDQKVEILRTNITDLEECESPYFLDFDLKNSPHQFLYMETSRGCPYGCTYCLASLDKKVRTFSLSYIQRHLERLNTIEVKQVKFLDRSFNLEKSRSYQIAQACVNAPKTVQFHLELVGDQIDDKLKQLIILNKERFHLEIGVQSFHSDVLEAVGRYSTLQKLKQTIHEFSLHDVHQHTDLIAGLPYESLDRLKDSLTQMVVLKPREIQLGILKLLKGSTLDKTIDDHYRFEKEAPYQIISNQWISSSEIKQVELVALAIDKLYNTQRLSLLLNSHFETHAQDAFDIFYKAGCELSKLPKPYTLKMFYSTIYNALKDDIKDSRYHFELAYYSEAKMRPERLFELTDLDLKSIVKQFRQHYKMYDRLIPVIIQNKNEIEFMIYQNQQAYHLKQTGIHL